MQEAHETRPVAGRGPLQHLQVAVGIAEGEERSPSDELVDGDGLPALSSMKSILSSRTRTGLPSCISKRVTIDEPITCSGGTPYTRSAHTRRNSMPPPDTM
jgi:hypothetical protein